MCVRADGNVKRVTVVMPGVAVHSVYKPPHDQFTLPALGYRNMPHIVTGDFNSHSTSWGYNVTDENGEAVEKWAELCNLTIVHNAKLPKSFNSARWKKGYNPALIFAAEKIANVGEKSIMDPNPHTHLLICVTVNPVVVTQPTLFRRRFKLRKAEWNGCVTELDTLIEDLAPIPGNYNRFV